MASWPGSAGAQSAPVDTVLLQYPEQQGWRELLQLGAGARNKVDRSQASYGGCHGLALALDSSSLRGGNLGRNSVHYFYQVVESVPALSAMEKPLREVPGSPSGPFQK